MNIHNASEEMKLCLKNACSFDLYRKTLDLRKNVATDFEYQKNFNHYYRVRRDADWLKQFYNFFEKNKNNKSITFAEILRYLSNIEHNVKKTAKNPTGKATTIEASFASKMLATIHPDHPIWDAQVLRALKIKTADSLDREEKIQECIKIYQKIEDEIAAFKITVEGKRCVEEFDKTFPSCKDFSEFKKIDFYLWNLGK